MYVFPRKRMQESLMNGAPPQSKGYTSDKGWTDSDLFVKWLEHFAEQTNASKETPSLILLDGHHSHKTLSAINFCREKGIDLLTFPPHTTHKLQPLDRSYFKSLKSSYNSCADRWLVENPGRRISIHEIATLSGQAFNKTATTETAVSGLKVSSMWP